MGLRGEVFFRWFDLWVGFYVDRVNRAVYFCPLPMVGIKLWWATPYGGLDRLVPPAPMPGSYVKAPVGAGKARKESSWRSRMRGRR